MREAVTHCLECGKRKRKPPQLKVAREHYEHDPFCSMECAREHHGVPLPKARVSELDYQATP